MPALLGLYNGLLLPVRAAVGLWRLWATRRPELARELGERLARTVPEVPPRGVWLHGASVGEAKLVSAVAERLRRFEPSLPVARSAFTRAGRAELVRARPEEACFFAPFDFPGLPTRLLEALRPRLVGLIETEIWPNLLEEAARSGIPVCLLNARLAPERMRRYRWLRGLYGPLLSRIERIGAQTEEDAARFLELGAREAAVTVTGNMKYDLPPPTTDRPALRRRFGIEESRPVVAAGSTAPGEDGTILDGLLEARRSHPDLFLLLAPRHPDRSARIEKEAEARGVRLHRLSSRSDREAGRTDGLLVDTLGDLPSLWPLADVAFVGGSLVPVGGHNVLEPASCGVPVVFGPFTHHIADPAAILEREGAAVRVREGGELGRLFAELLADRARRSRMADRARAVLEAHRGALDRSVRLVTGLLERAGAAWTLA